MSARRIGAGRSVRSRAGLAFKDVVLNAIQPDVYGRSGELFGTTLIDSSGFDHHGTLQSPTLGAASLVPSQADNAAITYAGSSGSYGQVPYASWMDAPSAVSLYVVCQTSASGSLQALIDRDDGSGNRVYQFRINSGVLEFIKIGGTGGIVTCTGPSGLADGAIHHLGASYDGTNLRVYADGVKITTTSAAGDLGTAGQRIQIGLNAGSSAPFNGTIDDWFVKNAILSDGDFASLYAAR